jgi:hypothetical protein
MQPQEHRFEQTRRRLRDRSSGTLERIEKSGRISRIVLEEHRFERSKAPRELWAKAHRFKIIQRESGREYMVNRPADLRRMVQDTAEKIKRWLKWR